MSVTALFRLAQALHPIIARGELLRRFRNRPEPFSGRPLKRKTITTQNGFLTELQSRRGLVQLPREVRDPRRVMLFARSDRSMSEQLLDCAQISPGLQQFDGEGIAEAVRVPLNPRYPALRCRRRSRTGPFAPEGTHRRRPGGSAPPWQPGRNPDRTVSFASFEP
jgi:hypothetical protein